MASDQANRTNYQHQNHGQHYRVLSDILSLVVPPQPAKKMTHVCAPFSTPRQFYAQKHLLRIANNRGQSVRTKDFAVMVFEFHFARSDSAMSCSPAALLHVAISPSVDSRNFR